jgi:hypothetical protein
MRCLVSAIGLAIALASPVFATDRLSGTWTTGGPALQTFVFEANGDCEGRWVFPGRVAQQNVTLKVRGQKVWGVILWAVQSRRCHAHRRWDL